MEHFSRVHIAKPERVDGCASNILYRGQPELGIPQGFIQTASCYVIYKRMSLYPLGIQKNIFRLRTVPLVMYRLFGTISIFFSAFSNSNFTKGMCCLLVNRGGFTLTNSSHPYLYSCLVSFGHPQNSMLYP